MSTIIGLAKARKLREKAIDKAKADANSVKFGRSKAQKLLEATQREKARHMLDAHRSDEE